MKNKLVLSDKNFVNSSITSILNNLLADWHDNYWELWTIESNINTLISKEFNKGDNLYDIIEELSGLIGAVWTVKDHTIIVKELLGEDKTSWPQFTEILYSWETADDTNISDISVESYSTIANIIIGSDNNSSVTLKDDTSISEFWALAEYKQFRDWDLTNQTQKYLDSKKTEQKVYNVEVEPFTIDANIGDKIKLMVETNNQYINFEWTVIVNKKEITIQNKTKIIKLSVSESYAYFDTFVNTLRQIQNDINLLKTNI